MINLIQQASFGASGLGLRCHHTLCSALDGSAAAMLADFMPMTAPAMLGLQSDSMAVVC